MRYLYTPETSAQNRIYGIPTAPSHNPDSLPELIRFTRLDRDV
jgi:hypothetical protein